MAYNYNSSYGSSSEGGAAVCRIYVGNLPSSVDQREVEKEFERFGKIIKCDVKKTISGGCFAFIEYDDPRDASDAIKERDGYVLHGCKVRVEIPFNSKTRGGGGGGRGGGRGERGGRFQRDFGRKEFPRRGKYILQISGLPLSGSWQDLKDHLRDAGECGYADVFRDGTGEVSFFSKKDAQYAVHKFNGSIFVSHQGEKSRITVEEKDGYSKDGDRAGGGRYRSRSHERSGGERYSDSRRRRDTSPSYSKDSGGRVGGGERDKSSDRYEKSRSRDRSRDCSRERSRDRSRSRNRTGGETANANCHDRKRYSSRSRSRGE